MEHLRGSAPEKLVRGGVPLLGSWEGVPDSANLIDVRRPYSFPLPRFLRRLRLKEWQAVQACDKDWFVFVVLYDAKFLSMASVDVWNRKNKQKGGFRRMFLGSRFSLPQSLSLGDVSFRAGGAGLSLRVDAAANSLELKAFFRAPKTRGGAKSPEKPSFDLALRFDLSAGKCAPFSVCLPLGLNRAMYSTKMLMPCSGSIGFGSDRHDFDPAAASGILDDHKGYYPYRLHYDWVTGLGIDASGRRIAFNLTDNQVKDQTRYNENRLWIDTALHRLPPVKITRPYGRDSAWIIQDTEGLVDLVFYPEAAHDTKMNFGVADIDYSGPFGRFEGKLISPEGETVAASRLYGMGEDKNLRL